MSVCERCSLSDVLSSDPLCEGCCVREVVVRDVVVRDVVVREEGGGRRRTSEEVQQKKHKNPTQQCGEKGSVWQAPLDRGGRAHRRWRG